MEDPISRETLVQWLDHTVRPMFDGRVLAVTEDVLLRSLLIRDFGRKRRHTYSDHALLIAATAVCNGLIIATRNIDDFELTGVPVLNPWTAA